MSKTAKRRKTAEEPQFHWREPVLGVPLESIPAEEAVAIHNPDMRVWAPAVVWYWLVIGQTLHPTSEQPLPPSEVQALIRAAARACNGSPAGPARFLVCGDADAKCPTEASIRSALAAQRPAPARLTNVYAERLDSIKDILLSECSLDCVRNAPQALQRLSVTWLWLYDSLWGQLVRLDPALAVQCMLTSALPAFLEAKTNSYAYHPVALLPLLRHFVYLEEYVCRSALGASEEGPWRYEVDAQPCARATHIGFAQWPLGSRSVIMPPPPNTPQYIDVCQTQLEALPLVEAHRAPPVQGPEAAEQCPLSIISSQFLHILSRGSLQSTHFLFSGVLNPEDELEAEFNDGTLSGEDTDDDM